MPPNVRGGGPEYHLPPPPKKKNARGGGLCPLGLVFLTLENVLCLTACCLKVLYLVEKSLTLTMTSYKGEGGVSPTITMTLV